MSIFNAFEMLSDNHQYFKFGNHFCFSKSMTTNVSLVLQTHFFFIYGKNFITCTKCVFIYNPNIYKVVSDSHKYFNLGVIFVLSHL